MSAMTMAAPASAPAVRQTTPVGRFATLLRREFWEHRGGFYWAPMWAGGGLFAIMMLVILALEWHTSGSFNGEVHVGFPITKLLAALKAEIKNRAYYWPTTDRLAFRFTSQLPEPEVEVDEDGEIIVKKKRKRPGFSSGERQLKSLQEIVAHTDAAIYLLDEWDANLDAKNRDAADALVRELSARARVVEISHRDRA